jgi:hypothetical protein
MLMVWCTTVVVLIEDLHDLFRGWWLLLAPHLEAAKQAHVSN